MPSFLPPPPRAPHPFVWRCCACGTPYRLAATRRCLQCAHRFCGLGAATPPSRPRRRPAPCRAAFDYDGWGAWAAWRAARPRHPATRPGASLAPQRHRRHRRLLAGASSCWDDCAFPSECRTVRFREAVRRRQEAAAAAAAAARVGPDEEDESEEEEGEERDTRTWAPVPGPPLTAAAASPAVDATRLSRAAILVEDEAMEPPDLLLVATPSSSSSSLVCVDAPEEQRPGSDDEGDGLEPDASQSDENDDGDEENEGEAVPKAWRQLKQARRALLRGTA